MVNKNDLSGLKLSPKNTLFHLKNVTTNLPAGNVGRKPKIPGEKQSVLVGLRFTPSEFEAIREKAGLVPVATYIRNELMTKTDLLSDGENVT